MSVTIEDHSAEVSDEIKAALLRGLEKCGLVAEGYAKKLCPVDTGNLRNSITHVVDEGGDAVYIGTNSEYGAYVIHKRNLAQESIIRAAGRRPGYTRTRTEIGITPTVTGRSRISSLPSRITRPNTARSLRPPSRTDNRIENAKPAADKMSAVGFLLW